MSVIIPSYNRADLLPRAIDSILSQSVPSMEIVIVDDASDDDTSLVLNKIKKSFPEVNIKVILHEKNKGEAAARNSGIKNTSGKYIAFLDADDEWLPGKLRKQLDFIKKTGSDAVGCEYYQVSDMEYASAKVVKIKSDIIEPKSLLTEGCGTCLGSAFLLTRESVLKTGFFDETLKLYVDMDWLYRYSGRYKVSILHDPLIYYHKAPMRNGDSILYAYKAYLSKHHDEFKKLTFLEKAKTLSNFNYHVSIAYYYHGVFRAALKYNFISIFSWPIRSPYVYLETAKLCIKSIFPEQKK